MDGNRRWARARGLPAAAGHTEGVARVEELLGAFRETGVVTVTLFGFASANWQRERTEVRSLLGLAEEALERFAPRCLTEGLCVEVIGRRDRLPARLVRSIEAVERQTAGGGRTLRIALDYSSRAAILEAARGMNDTEEPDTLSTRLGTGGDVDLLIRTGRERRLSDFLLWECAFAELYFSDLYWPEFGAAELHRALGWFAERERRFGA